VEFNRWNACATHDYGYDLWKFGTVGLDKNQVDDNFLDDMMADCGDRPLVARQGCEATARIYHQAVRTASPALGDRDGIVTAFE